MKVEAIAVAMLALACVGCEKHRADRDDRIAQCVASVVRSETRGLNGYRQGESFLDACAAMTNVESRIECLSRFAEALLSERLDGDGYRQWERSLSAVPSLVRSVCTFLSWSKADVEKVYDLRLQLLSWHRQQSAMLQAKRPSEECRPYDADMIAWRNCCDRVDASRKMTEDLLESRFFVETRGLPDERRAVIKNRIETALGRPMRSKTR
jgi:hypothetical protein